MIIRLLIWKNFMEESEIEHPCVTHSVDEWKIWIHYELFVSNLRHHLRKVQWCLQKLVDKYFDSDKANLFYAVLIGHLIEIIFFMLWWRLERNFIPYFHDISGLCRNTFAWNRGSDCDTECGRKQWGITKTKENLTSSITKQYGDWQQFLSLSITFSLKDQ